MRGIAIALAFAALTLQPAIVQAIESERKRFQSGRCPLTSAIADLEDILEFKEIADKFFAEHGHLPAPDKAEDFDESFNESHLAVLRQFSDWKPTVAPDGKSAWFCNEHSCQKMPTSWWVKPGTKLPPPDGDSWEEGFAKKKRWGKWRVFRFEDFSFKYPENWTLRDHRSSRSDRVGALSISQGKVDLHSLQERFQDFTARERLGLRAGLRLVDNRMVTFKTEFEYLTPFAGLGCESKALMEGDEAIEYDGEHDEGSYIVSILECPATESDEPFSITIGVGGQTREVPQPGDFEQDFFDDAVCIIESIRGPSLKSPIGKSDISNPPR